MILRFETSAGDALVVDGGRIAEPDTKADEVVDVGPGAWHPGLINAHDHLHRNHYPRLGAPPYDDAYAWGEDIHARCAGEIAAARSLDRLDALRFGAVKNLISGATTVVHHDAWEPAFDADFPIRVARVRTLHSLGFESDIAAALGASPLPRDAPLCIHVAEGINARAAHEVGQLDAVGLLDDRLLAVHCVGVDAEGVERLAAAGAAVVWCPSSNQFLFGRTVPIAALRAAGVEILLGSDSLLTGAGTLLEELRFARATGLLDDDALRAAVGAAAARRLGLPPPTLDPGAAADAILLRVPLLEATPADVALVLVGGRPMVADASIGGLAEDQYFETLAVGGVPKRLPAPLARAAIRATARSPECGRILEKSR